ncbi:phage minor tail U family protein [Pasteurellaceae bacterium TAE3-ERU1]|nr:phage minor tail U family protein [Pasteurellaceae bacterium TAE3-ERU1]
MIKHSKIRKQLVDVLKRSLPKVEEVVNGRMAFVDMEHAYPAVAVFISDVTPTDYLDGTVQATLHVALYMKSSERENDIDKLAEDIYQNEYVENAVADLVESVSFSYFDYQQDDEQANITAADIQYRITYNM